MRVGYGRGYYGDGQLAPRSRGGFGWGKIALVAGVGAVIWLMWPKKPKLTGDEPAATPPPDVTALPVSPLSTALPVSPLSTGASPSPPLLLPSPQQQISSQQAYEDAVVASARQLQAAGAKVVLAPHLQHLAPRLEGS